MGQWSVDAEGVLGVVTGVDTAGPDCEKAHRDITDAADSGATLSVGGRTVLSAAWETFIEDRALVPGKIMHTIAAAAGALSEATSALVAGDEQMSLDINAAQRTAESWGIAPPRAYNPSGGAS
ncbi:MULTISPECIES: DUF6507 family protein [Microbacterium]|uniref:Uncharacterized protein n=1 Tax=Microbacterium galbinum TaxID=2851646 RepID=A0ABY4IR65_9MICO|nr:DUF6507 family protein [Microbacterium galbinum]UPL13768.1 hypothetical protein KV396_04460 [Microbacterium galbinum]